MMHLVVTILGFVLAVYFVVAALFAGIAIAVSLVGPYIGCRRATIKELAEFSFGWPWILWECWPKKRKGGE